MKLYKQRIPIYNVYYMLCYVYSELVTDRTVSIEPEQFDNIFTLMAELMINGVSYQLKKGLLRSYEEVSDEIPLLRGKISISESIRAGSLIKRKLVCNYDEYTENTYMNRILKSVMLLLLRADIKNEQKTRISRLLRYFSMVDEVNLLKVSWNTMNYGRNHKEYKFLMTVCRVICDNMLHSTRDGNVKLIGFTGRKMDKLYEKFILNYYAVHHSDKVYASSPQIKWSTEDITPFLPVMQSDIVLTSRKNNKRLIIDAKLYSHSTVMRYNTPKFHSHNLYQIFTYVKNEAVYFDGIVDGMLLYARTEDDKIPDEGVCMDLNGNKLYIKTLDLSVHFDKIKQQLDGILSYVCC